MMDTASTGRPVTLPAMAVPVDRPAPLRVLVVDPDERVRQSLSGLLEIGHQVVVVGSAGQPGAALALADTVRPDVVIVDPRLPEVDRGYAFIGRLREAHPALRILVMSSAEGLEHLARPGGADGFIRKTFRPAELVAAVLAAARPGPA